MAETRVDRAEIARQVEKAEKLLQKGKSADALDVYLQVLEIDPMNDTVRSMAADLCLSLQRTADASRLLGELFERQLQTGDATRASLTYKKLARFANPTWQQKVRFGQLLENSNRKLAMETYENALADLNRAGLKPDCLSVLKKIVALDSSEKNLVRLGELSAEVGENKEAAAAFFKLGQLADGSGGNSAQWYEKAYGEDPTNQDVALAYSRVLLGQNQGGAVIFILQPIMSTGTKSPEIRDIYSKALLATNQLTEAEPLIWQQFEENPSRQPEVIELIGAFLDADQDKDAVALARKLEQQQRRKGERKSFASTMQDIAAKHKPSSELLEFMSELFNASNRETDYCQTLLKLFDLHFGMANYAKAAECLDRAVEVDIYEPGHHKRLESLRGKIDDSRFQVIASRFSGMNQNTAAPARNSEASLGAATLQDLMLQAEILVQYGMRGKAIERLQRIQELFPHEEETNQELQRLYLSAGMTPQYADSAPLPTSPPPAPKVATPATEAADVSSFTKVAEITQKLNRQATADAVLATATKEIGAQWKLSRCIAAMRKPGLAPSSIKEHCGEGVKPGEPSIVAKLIPALQDLVIKRGPLTVPDAANAPELQPVREAIKALNIGSLLALPFSDGSQHMGVIIFAHNASRTWPANDVVVLKTISDQVVIALNNAGLRRLVKNLSVTDENSGLLKRASYLDLLMGETQRSLQQGVPLTVMLMQFGKGGAMLREFGEQAVSGMMQQIGTIMSANIRQNDLAFRYETTTIALVLGETGEAEAVLALEKLRKLLTEVKMPGKEEPVSFNGGIAEAVVRQPFDAVDIVTEVINRAEQALVAAVSQGAGKVVHQPAAFASAAVA
jgi:GGDEF domain-containing protein/tetratricopeptide (TPR) repeat protein